MRALFILCALLGVEIALAAQTNSPSGASTQSPALVGTATNGPTLIRSDAGQFFLRSNVFVYRGNVRVDNPQMKLTCALLTVEAPKVDTGKFNRATAETNVVIDWTDDKGPNHATSAKAVYTYSLTNTSPTTDEHWETNAFVVLTGNPVVTNVDGTYRSDPIVWDRINDVIISTNSLNMQIDIGHTNTSGMFETAPPKTGATPK
jgi:lipopolysaccharide export system protein LptA